MMDAQLEAAIAAKPYVALARFRMFFAGSLFLLSAAAIAQSPTLPTTFEVATMTRSPQNHGPMSLRPWGSDTFSIKNASLDYLLRLAFGKPPYKIIGLPQWNASEAYDVEAKTPGVVLTDWKAARYPLQNLLRERLHLKTHNEQRTVNGYTLVSAKTGPPPKLKLVEGVLSSAYVIPGHVHGETVSLEGVANLLSTASGRPVLDRTGINGLYNIDIRFAATSAESDLPDLFTAIREQLGLRLHPAKLPLDVLVIDHVERIPTGD